MKVFRASPPLLTKTDRILPILTGKRVKIKEKGKITGLFAIPAVVMTCAK
jgi:hypothetical protein